MAPPQYEKVKPKSQINLENKQIYLAQVPADFDARKAEFKSETEIHCQGTTYFVNSSASLSECDVLQASKKGELTPSSTKLAGLLAFTKKVALPKIDYEKAIQSKPLVPQKENLRMRHFPTGYGPKSFGIETDTSSSSTGSGSASKSRNAHTKDDGGDSEEKLHKKRKKEKSEDSEKKKKKKSHKHKSGKTE